MIPTMREQAEALHDVSCAEGPDCRSRSMHVLAQPLVNAGLIQRYHERLEEMAELEHPSVALGYETRVVYGETLTDLRCQRATGLGEPMFAHGPHRWDETPFSAELAEAACLPMGPFWCEGLMVHPDTMAGGA